MYKDKVVVVTGASRGIGKAIALEFDRLGAKVVILYSGNHAAAEETLSQLKGGASFQTDVSDAQQVEATFKEILSKHQKIDILVNNAGITRDNLLMRMKLDEWQTVIDTNLKGVYLCTKAVVRTMLKNKSGKIINISSIIGQTGNVGQSNYAAAKAGVIGLTKSVAKELAVKGITVNAIAPGYITTDMTNAIDPQVKSQMVKLIPLGREGLPEEIAYATTFLASDMANYITGQVLNVDGGMAI